MSKRARQYIGIAAAVVAYYIIHAGAHLLCALGIGAFKRINCLQLGIQIDVFAERMTDAQMGLFCLVGAVATLIAGWLLTAGAKTICKSKSKLLRAVLIINALTFWKSVLPAYTRSFQRSDEPK